MYDQGPKSSKFGVSKKVGFWPIHRSRSLMCVHAKNASFTLFHAMIFSKFSTSIFDVTMQLSSIHWFFASHPHVARTLQTSNLLAWRCQRAHTHATAHTIPT